MQGELHQNVSAAGHSSTTMKTVFSCCCFARRMQAHAQERVWRCGNEYTNNATDAQKRGCKIMEGGNVTVVQGPRPAAAAAASAAAAVRAPAAARASKAPTSARATARRARCCNPNCKQGRDAPGRTAQGIQQRRAREAGQRKPQLPEVPGPRGRDEGRDRPQRERHRRHPPRDRPPAGFRDCQLMQSAIIFRAMGLRHGLR